MAFSINVVMFAEYRGMRTGVSASSGRQWMSVMFEDEDAQQLSISVPNDLIADVYQLGLRKGDSCNIAFRAVARADGNSYLMLNAIPELTEVM